MDIESEFSPPVLRPSPHSLRRHFASESAARRAPLRNYHREEPLDEERKRSATPAAVLVPIVRYADELRLLLTRRHHEISYPGHVCFPGGRADPADRDAEETALREAEEEIGLDRRQVEVLGRLGPYYTQTNYRITPVVALVEPPFDLTPAPGEVSEILEIPLSVVTRGDSYALWAPGSGRDDAYYRLQHGELMVTGPTVCLFMGFYEELARTHVPESDTPD